MVYFIQCDVIQTFCLVIFPINIPYIVLNSFRNMQLRRTNGLQETEETVPNLYFILMTRSNQLIIIKWLVVVVEMMFCKQNESHLIFIVCIALVENLAKVDLTAFIMNSKYDHKYM